MNQSDLRLIDFFKYDHLSKDLQNISKPVGELAKFMLEELQGCDEKTIGLRKLLEAKDCFVRAQLQQLKT